MENMGNFTFLFISGLFLCFRLTEYVLSHEASDKAPICDASKQQYNPYKCTFNTQKFQWCAKPPSLCLDNIPILYHANDLAQSICVLKIASKCVYTTNGCQQMFDSTSQRVFLCLCMCVCVCCAVLRAHFLFPHLLARIHTLGML